MVKFVQIVHQVLKLDEHIWVIQPMLVEVQTLPNTKNMLAKVWTPSHMFYEKLTKITM